MNCRTFISALTSAFAFLGFSRTGQATDIDHSWCVSRMRDGRPEWWTGEQWADHIAKAKFYPTKAESDAVKGCTPMIGCGTLSSQRHSLDSRAQRYNYPATHTKATT